MLESNTVRKGCSRSFVPFYKHLYISHIVPVFGSHFITSFQTLVTVQGAREHPVTKTDNQA